MLTWPSVSMAAPYVFYSKIHKSEKNGQKNKKRTYISFRFVVNDQATSALVQNAVKDFVEDHLRKPRWMGGGRISKLLTDQKKRK